MIDAPVVLRSFLLAQTALTVKTSTRIWGDRNNPIKGYLPSQGAAVVFRPKGGLIDYSDAVLTVEWQFKCYGEDEDKAREAYRLLFDVLNEKSAAGMWRAFNSGIGYPLEEPANGWNYYLSFWTTLMMATYEVTP